MRALWLPQVLRDAGLTVVEHAGWETRGKELTDILGVVCHHTASSPRTSDSAVVQLLIVGRPDLKGPLCQLGLRRSGVFDLITSGRGSHNGYGEWGNASIGIEAYNDGIGEPWPDVQVDAYQRGCAAIVKHLGLSAVQVKGHKETDPGRKIDPAGINMLAFRERVVALLADPTPPPPKDWLMALTDQQQKDLYDWVKELREEVILPKDAKGKTRLDRMAADSGANRAALARLEAKD